MKSFVHFVKVPEENILKQQIKSSLCINIVSTGVSHSSVSLGEWKLSEPISNKHLILWIIYTIRHRPRVV